MEQGLEVVMRYTLRALGVEGLEEAEVQLKNSLDGLVKGMGEVGGKEGAEVTKEQPWW